MKKGELANILKIIGEENRLIILCALFKNKNKMCVSQISKEINLSIATTSHHLKALEKNNLVISQREGKEICYFISKDEIMSDTKKLICKYTNI